MGFWFWQVRSLRPTELPQLVLVGVVDDDALASTYVTTPPRLAVTTMPEYLGTNLLHARADDQRRVGP